VKPQKNKFPAWHHEDNNGKPLFSHEQKSLGFRENVTKREVT
jgi:hypothetical protein